MAPRPKKADQLEMDDLLELRGILGGLETFIEMVSVYVTGQTEAETESFRKLANRALVSCADGIRIVRTLIKRQYRQESFEGEDGLNDTRQIGRKSRRP